MSFNKYHDYQFLYLDKKIKERKKKSNYVKLSCATPTSLNNYERKKITSKLYDKKHIVYDK